MLIFYVELRKLNIGNRSHQALSHTAGVCIMQERAAYILLRAINSPSLVCLLPLLCLIQEQVIPHGHIISEAY